MAVQVADVNPFQADALKVQPDFRTIRVVIEDLPEDAKRIGLSEERIRNKVEVKFRSLGFKIEEGTKHFFYIRISVVGNTVAAEAAFVRNVYLYQDSSLLRLLATVWSQGITGGHGGDGSYILEGVERLEEKFLNEYLKANQ